MQSVEGSGPARFVRDEDAFSVATSAISYRSTQHSHNRRGERFITSREIRGVLKHGLREPDRDGKFRYQYLGVVVIMAQDQRTVVTTYRATETEVRSDSLIKCLAAFDGPNGEWLNSGGPFGSSAITLVQAVRFMNALSEGCHRLAFPDVMTLLLNAGCGMLEQALQAATLADPCWTVEQLGQAVRKVHAQDAPHPRMQALLQQAEAGAALPEPFPWATAAHDELDTESLLMYVGNHGGVLGCGTDLSAHNLLHLYCHNQNVEAVRLLLATGGDIILDAPNTWGRPPIFSAAGGRSLRKATLITKLLSDARASVDWHDENGRGIIHHVAKRLDARLEVLRMLLTDRGCSLSDRDRFGNTPLMHLELKLGMSDHAQGPNEGTLLVRDCLRGHAVCAASLEATPTASVTLRLHAFCLLDASVASALPHGAVRAAGLVVFRRAPRLEYLLVQSATGGLGWTPPKGKCEPGEMDVEAAYRETREEAGLIASQLRLLSEKPVHEVTYFDRKIRSDKVSVYFVAELADPRAQVRIRGGRLADYAWLSHDAGKVRTQYGEMKDVIDAAAAAIEVERAA